MEAAPASAMAPSGGHANFILMHLVCALTGHDDVNNGTNKQDVAGHFMEMCFRKTKYNMRHNPGWERTKATYFSVDHKKAFVRSA